MWRMTFLLDETGRIQRIWSTVKPDGHAAEILAVIQGG
jgi:peroxiredoxin